MNTNKDIKNILAEEIEGLNVLFINPSTDVKRDQEYIISLRVYGIPRQQSPHIGIGYLLAMAKLKCLKAAYIDMIAYDITVDQILQYIQKNRPSLIGFTAYTTQIKSAGIIAKKIKDRFPNILICIGGPHATVIPLDTLKEFDAFDFVVCGEGELILLQIFENLRQELPLSIIKGVATREKIDISYSPIEDLDDLPFPAWEEFDLTKYPGDGPHCGRLELPVSTSRGCPFSCIFCVRPFGMKRRRRSIQSIINEINRDINYFGCNAIFFTDETFVIDLEWSKELFYAMIKEGIHNKIKWHCEIRVDIVSPEILSLMKKAGCYHVFFGFENGDDTVLKNIKKGFTVSQIKNAVQWAKDSGLICAGSFILGLPGETEESINKSIKLAQELDIYSVTFPIAVPFPGTVIRNMAIKNEYGLRILSNNWDDYGKQYPGVMDSAKLNIEKLRSFQKKAYEYNPKKRLSDHIDKLRSFQKKAYEYNPKKRLSDHIDNNQ